MTKDIVSAARDLNESIVQEADARKRMQLCRRAIGLGRTAVKEADTLSDAEVIEIQDTLRLAHQASRGLHNPNATITKLAKVQLDRLGISALPIISATKPKRVSTDAACLALSDKGLPDNWFDTSNALEGMNAEKFGLVGVGADGAYSVCLRLIDLSEHFLEPGEYKKIVEVLPPFAIKVHTERLYFGAAENLESGADLSLANGRYTCSIATLRSGKSRRLLATVIKSDKPVPVVHQIPEMNAH